MRVALEARLGELVEPAGQDQQHDESDQQSGQPVAPPAEPCEREAHDANQRQHHSLGRATCEPQLVRGLQIQLLGVGHVIEISRGNIDLAITIEVAYQQRERVAADEIVLARCEFAVAQIHEYADGAASVSYTHLTLPTIY